MLVNVINYNSVYDYPEELISIVCIYIIPSLRRIDIYWGYMQDTMMYCEMWKRQLTTQNIWEIQVSTGKSGRDRCLLEISRRYSVYRKYLRDKSRKVMKTVL